MKKCSLLLCLVFFLSCNSKEPNTQTENPIKKGIKKVVNKVTVPKTISIYRYGDFSVSKAQRKT